MTREERHQRVLTMIDGHARVMAALRVANQEIAATNTGFDGAVAGFHAANAGFDKAIAGFHAASLAIGRMVDAHETALAAALSIMQDALRLLDEEGGVQ